MNHLEYGAIGEKLAQNFLRKQGYKIVVVNYSKKAGEIDIIAVETKKARKNRADYKELSKIMKKENVLVFVEVKSRNCLKFGMPSEAVNRTKTKHYNLVASNFRLTNKKYSHLPFRFDIIEVVGDKVYNHYMNAF